MIVEQIYTSCLSQGSYYIESNNEVAIIDPIREIDSYIERASKTNSKIKYIFETHLHADFISGHITLAKRTGADIVYGPDVETSFNILSAKDGQEFKIGNEIAHGVPALWSPNSNCNKPVSVTLKSGNFGQADFFKRALQILRGKT